MHKESVIDWQHDHSFARDTTHAERNTRIVVIITVVMMGFEIVGGSLFGSMALLADGWHMGTHAAALGIAVFAYAYARRHSSDRRFSFGTGKIGALGGFSSAIFLLVIALMMAIEAVQRLIAPQVIQFNEAIAIAVIGLAVNLFSAFLLRGNPTHEHEHAHHHSHENEQAGEHDVHHTGKEESKHHNHGHEHEHDHNLRAAYLHVLADAMTSLLAIFALLTGKAFGWVWMDALMGFVGSLVIIRWSYGLIKGSSAVLLDRSINPVLENRVQKAIENDSDNRVADLHLWQVDVQRYAAVISLVTDAPKSVDHYKSLLESFEELSHITIEVHRCSGEPILTPLAEGS